MKKPNSRKVGTIELYERYRSYILGAVLGLSGSIIFSYFFMQPNQLSSYALIPAILGIGLVIFFILADWKAHGRAN
jgi:uncharacterized membrane protein YeaQ/YmgE (transglycosylase-associated protein family)